MNSTDEMRFRRGGAFFLSGFSVVAVAETPGICLFQQIFNKKLILHLAFSFLTAYITFAVKNSG
jgi:hypothetical protein